MAQEELDQRAEEGDLQRAKALEKDLGSATLAAAVLVVREIRYSTRSVAKALTDIAFKLK